MPRISSGARQLLVGPASASFSAQMKVLKDPREFPKDVEFEALLYLPSNAVALQQGREPDQTEDFGDSVSYETFSNRAGWGASALAD